MQNQIVHAMSSFAVLCYDGLKQVQNNRITLDGDVLWSKVLNKTYDFKKSNILHILLHPQESNIAPQNDSVFLRMVTVQSFWSYKSQDTSTNLSPENHRISFGFKKGLVSV